MKCAECGHELEPGSELCFECGSPVRRTGPSTSSYSAGTRAKPAPSAPAPSAPPAAPPPVTAPSRSAAPPAVVPPRPAAPPPTAPPRPAAAIARPAPPPAAPRPAAPAATPPPKPRPEPNSYDALIAEALASVENLASEASSPEAVHRSEAASEATLGAEPDFSDFAAAPAVPAPPAAPAQKPTTAPAAKANAAPVKRRPRVDEDEKVRCPGCGIPSTKERCPSCGTRLRPSDD